MKILFLSDSNSPHTFKWVTSLAEKNIEVCLFSFFKTTNEIYKTYDNIRIESLEYPLHQNITMEAHISKINYLRSVPLIKRLIKQFKPDIIHSHYLSSYGLVGALSNFHPFVISVWGADIFNFPNRSGFHKKITRYSLSHADKICSTSYFMADEIIKYSSKQIEVIPFGVDLEKFKPTKVQNLFENSDIVVGTIKALEDKYGIDLLIKSFSKVKAKHPELPLKLLIVGSGTKEKELKELTNSYRISDQTLFTGYVEHSEIQKYHNMLDISLFLSTENSESFGVSVIEASACEKPVVVSNIGGLPEVVENNITGIMVEPDNIEQSTNALEKLILNKELRIRLGKNGREMVKSRYGWENSINRMIKIYETL